MANSNTERIEYLDPYIAQKTLGSMTCLMGNPAKALERMADLARVWVDTVLEGNLAWRDIWFMVSRQFWPRLGYGIGCNMATLPQLILVLRKQYYHLLPLGGYIQSGPTDFRMLDIGFAGVGCPHPGVKCLISQINKIQSHFGCPSSVGVELKTSMELFILNLGF